MKVKDEFISKLLKKINFENKNILEIGCGDGFRTHRFAQAKGSKINAIDPDVKSIFKAKKNNSEKNIEYIVGSAEKLSFNKSVFDIVIFTLSLHHILLPKKALGEARRVLKNLGVIVVIEPGFEGSIFEAEIFFDCFDGDERNKKAKTYQVILQDSCMKEKMEFWGKTEWQFDSLSDFKKNMHPKKNLQFLGNFLKENQYKLIGERRINVFKKI